MCLAAGAEGQNYRLHASRPVTYERVRADVIGWDGLGAVVEETAAVVPAVARVELRGPIEQRAGFHDECGAWSDGNDAIAERLCAALRDPECGSVLFSVDSPGGSPVGLAEGVRRVVEAKAETGKRIVGWIDDGMAASAGFWWISCVCDVIYMPRDGAAGSIGARFAHADLSAALNAEGVVITHFAWPCEGKIAFTPDQPLSDLARERGDRDINLIGETFGAAVATSRRLDIVAIRALKADLLMGPAAVAAGLVDGIATYEETMSYALALAGGGEVIMPEDEKEPGARAEGEDNNEPGAEDEGPAMAKCGQCSTDNDEDASYCKSCGLSMGGKPAAEPADEETEEDEDDKGPPSSKREPKEAHAASPPKAMPATSSLAAILGAKSDSPLALKTAATHLRQIRDTAAGVTGQTAPSAIVGGLLSMPGRLEAAAQVVADRKVEKAKADKAERWALCHRGIATGAPEMQRKKVIVDEVGDDGKRKAMKLTPQYAEMKLGTLRGLVEGYETTAKKRSPFEPDREESASASKDAQGAAIGADGKPTAAALARAKKDPTVLKMFHAQGNKHTLDTLAEQYVINAAANGITIGGGQ